MLVLSKQIQIYLNYIRIENYKQFRFHFVILWIYCHINDCFSRLAKRLFALLKNAKSFEFENKYKKLLKKYILTKFDAKKKQKCFFEAKRLSFRWCVISFRQWIERFFHVDKWQNFHNHHEIQRISFKKTNVIRC